MVEVLRLDFDFFLETTAFNNLVELALHENGTGGNINDDLMNHEVGQTLSGCLE